jgi:hypothetical protein
VPDVGDKEKGPLINQGNNSKNLADDDWGDDELGDDLLPM